MKRTLKNKLPDHQATKRTAAHRRGATAVEFAIVSPIVFLTFFAAFEFCRVAMIRHTVDNAVYEGARRGIVPGANANDAREQAEFVLNTIGVNSANITVTPAIIDENTQDVTVRVRIPLDGNSFIPLRFFGGKSVDGEITMKREGVF